MRRKTPRNEHQVGKYKLIRLIAEGGMGQVYEARHIELGRRAAVKLLRPDLSRNEETATRFFNEARAASLIHHAGLVQVYEYGALDDDGAYIVMEYVQGELLRDRMKRCGGRLPLTLAIPIARQLASALQAAHEKGIIHRDLKPENVKLIPDDEAAIGERVKVLDFGVAKMLMVDTAYTLPGQLLGTPVYMAPEQAGASGGIGPHTDVYSLGVLLFELVSGRAPFEGEDAAQLIGQHLFASPPRLRTELPDADPMLDELLQRMLSKSPEQRPTMQGVVNELGQIERRLRLTASGLAHTAEGQQAETVVFQKASLDRSEPLLDFLQAKKKTLLKGAAGALCLFIVSFGSWLIIKGRTTPHRVVNMPVDTIIESPMKLMKSENILESAATSVTDIVDLGLSVDVIEKPQAPRISNIPKAKTVNSYRATEKHNPKVLNYDPEDAVGTLTQAQSYLEMGQYRSAIELATSVEKRKPSQAWWIKGMAACGKKDIKLADEAYNRLEPASQRDIMNACRRHGVERTFNGFRIRN